MQLLWLTTVSIVLALNLEEVAELWLITNDSSQFAVSFVLMNFLSNSLRRLHECLSRLSIFS